MKQTIEQRLNKHTKVDVQTGCWNWIAYKDRDGYGNIQIKRSPKQAHRISYTERVGEIPEGLVVRHTCDNPSCINPEHLLLGTHLDNQNDKKVRQRVVGILHPYAKLNNTDIENIRTSTLSQSKLGIMYGVTQAHIGRIKRRVNWTHI